MQAYQKLIVKIKGLKKETYNATRDATASLPKELLCIGVFKLNTTEEEHRKELHFSPLLNRANVQIQGSETKTPTSLTAANSSKKSELYPNFWDVCTAQVKYVKKKKKERERRKKECQLTQLLLSYLPT